MGADYLAIYQTLCAEETDFDTDVKRVLEPVAYPLSFNGPTEAAGWKTNRARKWAPMDLKRRTSAVYLIIIGNICLEGSPGRRNDDDRCYLIAVSTLPNEI
jgi:hypothetical protein